MPSMSPPVDGTHFKEVQKFRTDYSDTTITLYESTRTGLRAVVVDQEGPMVHGSFALATEIHDDSGAPHTLEHLCFMGSKNYPYKGILDKLAIRAYSDTNAFTGTEYTGYTLHSAGWDGFIQILPVYLEHIIVPTLTDASCYTEVHHVDGAGNDAGVVYSEMQGSENSLMQLVFQKSKRMLYPEGIGFRYETFGVMESLRKLTINRIREFHRDMYQPKNLCLVIIGEVDHLNLLSVLDKSEETILQDVPKPAAPFRRPWVDSKQAPALEMSLIDTVEFPDEDESSGQITNIFFGPRNTDKLSCKYINPRPTRVLADLFPLGRAMGVLLAYLAGSSASVLENTLVEREQVASAVYYETEERPSTVITFTLTGVATDQLEIVHARFIQLLKETAAQSLDMNYMLACVRRERLQLKFYFQQSAFGFEESIAHDHLFGKRDGSDLRADLETLKEYDVLEAWDDSQWRNFLKLWISEAPSCTVLGKPSSSLSAKIKFEERVRVDARRKDLGAAGLNALQKRLEAAKAENDKEVPKTLLQRFEVPSTKSIHFINTTTARSGTARNMGPLENSIQELIDEENDLPLFIHFEHIKSNFVSLRVVMGTEVIPINLRPLLAIYMENFFGSSMERDGQVIPFEQVIMGLEGDTVEYTMESGQGIGNSELIAINLQVEADKYQAGIEWLNDLMWSSIFDVERIQATVTRLLADIPDAKRDGGQMVYAAELMVSTAPSSASRACSTLVKALYLKRIRHLLIKDPKVVLDQLAEVRSAVCHPSNLRILVTADIEKLQRPVSSWKIITEGHDTLTSLRPLDTRLSRLSDIGRTPGNSAYVIPMAPIDSSFALVVSKGPSSLIDPIMPALMVAISYLNAVEGPLWTAVRGPGLAYGVNFDRHVNSGQVSLFITNSPNALKAFLACKDTVEELVSSNKELDELALEGAMSSIVLDFASREATKDKAAQASFVRQVIHGVPKEWPTIILEKVRNVQPTDIKKALREILLPVFEAQTANLFITCALDMEKDLVTGFRELGFAPEVRTLTCFQDDYGLVGEEGADQQDGDTEDDEDGQEDMGSDDSEHEVVGAMDE